MDISLPSVLHPLDPLTRSELARCVHLIRAELVRRRRVPDEVYIARVDLREPNKSEVVAFDAAREASACSCCAIGGCNGRGPTVGCQCRCACPVAPERAAEFQLRDRPKAQTLSGIVSLTRGAVTRMVVERPANGGQAALCDEEYVISEQLVRDDPRVQAILASRGIPLEDVEMVMSDMWLDSISDTKGRRIATPLLFQHLREGDNAYARPIDGIEIRIDNDTLTVLEVEETIPIPLLPFDEYADFADGHVTVPPRTDRKPLIITQPEGPSFVINGREIEWQRWRLRVGWTAREGLVLHTVSYYDALTGKRRPVAYRLSCAEMVVPYGDPRSPNYNKNAFDAGEDGLGRNANPLSLGCDCKGEIRYMDAAMVDSSGNDMTCTNAVCIHEEDDGILWKHTDWRTGDVDSRRSRVLVISFFATVANYDYGFYWTLTEGGEIKAEVKLTGILSVSGLAEGEDTEFGTMVAPRLFAPIHQHFFSFRLDMAVDDWEAGNAVAEVDSAPLALGDPQNPYASAFRATETVFESEAGAQSNTSEHTGRCWRVFNTNKTNRLGKKTAYRLVPGSQNCRRMADPSSTIGRRAAFLDSQLWVTAYDRTQRYPAGEYIVGSFGKDGLPVYAAADRPLVDADVVVWYNMGSHHVVRGEDWPIMNVLRANFWLMPDGFFDCNPAIDVAPEDPVEMAASSCSTNPSPGCCSGGGVAPAPVAATGQSGGDGHAGVEAEAREQAVAAAAAMPCCELKARL